MKTMPRSSIEMLECRIAPAAIFTFTDSNGDLVTIEASKGSNTNLATAVAISANEITSITLPSAIYEGSNLSITAHVPAGGHGLGQVAVPLISASGTNLGIVSVDGDVGQATIGSSTAGVPAAKSFTAVSIGLSNSAVEDVVFQGAVPNLHIEGDVGPYGHLEVKGSVTTALIGGSLEGEVPGNGGAVGGGVLEIIGSVASITVKGAVIGGAASYSGNISVTASLLPTKVSVGSLLGGAGIDCGSILGIGNIGSVTVTKDIVAGTGTVSGSIAATLNLASVTVDGSIDGNATGIHEIAAGVDVATGVFANIGSLGSVTVKGSAGESGAYWFTAEENVGSVAIGGDVTAATISSGGNIGSVKIGGDLLFSSILGHGSGTGLAIGSVSVGGNEHYTNIDAGAALGTGFAANINAVLGSVTIAGQAISDQFEGGTVAGTSSKIDSLKIGGLANTVTVSSDWIVSVSIDGQKVPLAAGAGNDNDVSFYGAVCNEV